MFKKLKSRMRKNERLICEFMETQVLYEMTIYKKDISASVQYWRRMKVLADEYNQSRFWFDPEIGGGLVF